MAHRRIVLLLLLLVASILTACSPAAKYVLVTDRGDVNFTDGDRFYICLVPQDAERVNGMLNLRRESDVRNYDRTRTGTGDPLEELLLDVLKADYHSAQAVLDRSDASLPLYLRLLLEADLAYETNGGQIPAARLVKMYQHAFEKQACDLNKDLIKMRVRQVRYGR